MNSRSETGSESFDELETLILDKLIAIVDHLSVDQLSELQIADLYDRLRELLGGRNWGGPTDL